MIVKLGEGGGSLKGENFRKVRILPETQQTQAIYFSTNSLDNSTNPSSLLQLDGAKTLKSFISGIKITLSITLFGTCSTAPEILAECGLH